MEWDFFEESGLRTPQHAQREKESRAPVAASTYCILLRLANIPRRLREIGLWIRNVASANVFRELLMVGSYNRSMRHSARSEIKVSATGVYLCNDAPVAPNEKNLSQSGAPAVPLHHEARRTPGRC